MGLLFKVYKTSTKDKYANDAESLTDQKASEQGWGEERDRLQQNNAASSKLSLNKGASNSR